MLFGRVQVRRRLACKQRSMVGPLCTSQPLLRRAAMQKQAWRENGAFLLIHTPKNPAGVSKKSCFFLDVSSASAARGRVPRRFARELRPLASRSAVHLSKIDSAHSRARRPSARKFLLLRAQSYYISTSRRNHSTWRCGSDIHAYFDILHFQELLFAHCRHRKAETAVHQVPTTPWNTQKRKNRPPRSSAPAAARRAPSSPATSRRGRASRRRARRRGAWSSRPPTCRRRTGARRARDTLEGGACEV